MQNKKEQKKSEALYDGNSPSDEELRELEDYFNEKKRNRRNRNAF